MQNLAEFSDYWGFFFIEQLFFSFFFNALQGTGLSAKECEICDFFVYIPQYGGGTASLNVTVAASIILHHFGGIANLYLILLYKCL